MKSVVMFRTPYNVDHTVVKGLRTTQPSKTVPNAVLTIREILSRFRRGAPLPSKEPQYYGDEEIIDPRTVDFVDGDAIREAGRQKIKQLQEELEAARRAKNQPPKPASAASGPRSDKDEKPSPTDTESE